MQWRIIKHRTINHTKYRLEVAWFEDQGRAMYRVRSFRGSFFGWNQLWSGNSKSEGEFAFSEWIRAERVGLSAA